EQFAASIHSTPLDKSDASLCPPTPRTGDTCIRLSGKDAIAGERPILAESTQVSAWRGKGDSRRRERWVRFPPAFQISVRFVAPWQSAYYRPQPVTQHRLPILTVDRHPASAAENP